ncbi:hypothetical protein BH10BAC4_BH10BAC4_22450 [soil metagenome]
MTLHVKIIGIILITLAGIHSVFPKRFDWVRELSSLSLINRQMMQVHTFFIALTIFLMGLLCLTSSNDLIENELGRRISLGLAIFWVCRLAIQFFGYSSKLWKGKTFETTIHIVFSLLWTYFSVVFIIASHAVFKFGTTNVAK